MFVAVSIHRDDPEYIAEVDRMMRQKIDIEAEIEAVGKTKRVIRREIDRGPLFLYHFMTAEDQTVGLGKIACLKEKYSSNTK